MVGARAVCVGTRGPRSFAGPVRDGSCHWLRPRGAACMICSPPPVTAYGPRPAPRSRSSARTRPQAPCTCRPASNVESLCGSEGPGWRMQGRPFTRRRSWITEWRPEGWRFALHHRRRVRQGSAPKMERLQGGRVCVSVLSVPRRVSAKSGAVLSWPVCGQTAIRRWSRVFTGCPSAPSLVPCAVRDSRARYTVAREVAR